MTEDRSFQSLSDRLAGLPIDKTLRDDVPDWLAQPLRDWLQTVFWDEEESKAEHLARRALMRLRLTRYGVQGYVEALTLYPHAGLLTMVDAIVQLHPAWDTGSPYFQSMLRDKLETLNGILADAGSRYRIDFNGRCLVGRVDSTVQAAVDSAIAAATPTAADYLRTAWVAAYGLHPDPDKAYDQAILAIEDLTCPLVCPRNTKATFGVVIGDLRNQAAQWELSIEDTSTGKPADIGSVIQMLDLLWKGQSRHAGSPNSRQQTQTEAEAAVHMAAALAQWISAGVLHRKP